MIRKDIQALRALAVMGVFVYHMRPSLLTGGFVGVDVFFVLSGFLISTHLFSELDRNGRISFGKFWARRAKRLLPASFTVLIASAIGVWLLAPQTFQERFYRDITGAALYVANWVFAFDSVDYLAADNSPSVAQHFWSLGVEEQLYIVWPLILGLAWFIGVKIKREKLALAFTLSVIAVASLIHSAALVFDNNPIAYFSTFSRAWEFAAGGLLGLWMLNSKRAVNLPASVANLMSWVGWLTLLGYMFVFDARAGFPGVNAIVPVLATVLIIGAGDPAGKLSLRPILHFKPIQFLGDASYSIYLWHWPILIFVGFNYASIPGRVLIWVFVATILVAWLSMKLIENPFRFGKLKTSLNSFKVFVGVATGMALIVSGSQIASAVVASDIEKQTLANLALEQELAKSIAEQESQEVSSEEDSGPVWDSITCMGPAFMVEPECASLTWQAVVPGVSVKEETASDVDPLVRIGSEKGCLAWGDSYTLIECVYGVLGGTRVALLGDSHSYHWLPAFAQMAKQKNLELHFVARAGCPVNTLAREANGDHVRGCFSWIDEVQAWIQNNEKFEQIVIANFSGTRFAGAGEYGFRQTAAVEGYKEAWDPMLETGAELVVLKDTPFIGEDAWKCVVSHPEDMNRCSVPLAAMEAKYDNSAAAGVELGLRVLDFTKYFCDSELCPMAIGGVRVYRDSNHMSGTYSLLMTPYLEREFLD